MTHISFYRTLFRQWLQFPSRRKIFANSAVYQFFVQYFKYHVVIAKTAFPIESRSITPNTNARIDLSDDWKVQPQPEHEQEKPVGFSDPLCEDDVGLVRWASTENLALDMDMDTLDQISPYNCISSHLLLLINEITELKDTIRSCHPDKLTEVAAHGYNFLRLEKSLESLHQRLPPHLERQSLAGWTMLQIAEAYRLAALIMLYETIALMPRRRRSPEPACAHAENENDYVRRVLGLVQEILEAPESPQLTASWPLWPLFVAGCCVQGPSDRRLVRALFDRAESEKLFGNIAAARKVVEMVWKQDDDQVYSSVPEDDEGGSNDQLTGVGWDKRNAGMLKWERVNEVTGYKISLA